MLVRSARDALELGASAQQTYHVDACNPAHCNPATNNVFFSQQITAVGGNGNYTLSPQAGDRLPPGITLQPHGGLLSGTPTSSNTYTFTLKAIDNDGDTGYRPYTLQRRRRRTASPSIRASLPDGTRGVGYNQTLTTQSGSGGTCFPISGGSLPPGLSLNLQHR